MHTGVSAFAAAPGRRNRSRSYQSAGHPERMQLVFTTQLHHQLQSVARKREVASTLQPGLAPPSSTSSTSSSIASSSAATPVSLPPPPLLPPQFKKNASTSELTDATSPVGVSGNVPGSGGGGMTPHAITGRRRSSSNGTDRGSVLAARRAMEVNGWEVERKTLKLRELRPMLEKPSFFYSDCGSVGASSSAHSAEPRMATVNAGGTSGSQYGQGSAASSTGSSVFFFSIDSYFNKTLPLLTGQHSLLDLWEYLLDMCDHVPFRNRCRSLYLHCTACIGRRAEFIPGWRIEGDAVTVDAAVYERYNHLLARCVALCTDKLEISRTLMDEYALFIAHVFAIVSIRFPQRFEIILDAVVDCTDRLETKDPPPGGMIMTSFPSNGMQLPGSTTSRGGDQKQEGHRSDTDADGRDDMTRAKATRPQCRSPRNTRRHWNAPTTNDITADSVGGISFGESSQQAVISSFSRYKQNRRVERRPCPVIINELSKSSHPLRRTVDSTLEAALEANVDQHDCNGKVSVTEREETFIRDMPIFFTFSAVGNQAMSTAQDRTLLDHELDRGLGLFAERLRNTQRDDLSIVHFVGAFLSDVSTWCDPAVNSRPNASNTGMLWHCIPGYFCLIRSFTAVFKRMCQRRPRSIATVSSPPSKPGGKSSWRPTLPTVSNGHTSPQSDRERWLSYWSNHEVGIVMDTLSEILKNTRLVDTFVEIVLEGTNILDPASVDYSLSILERVMEVGAVSAAASGQPKKRTIDSDPRVIAIARRGCLNDSFDDAYFCSAMRKALQSAHVQILLKALTFLYNSIDLLPPRARRRIMGELVLRDNFFRLFLNWNDEVRRIYCYIIVFKLFASNRVDLPCMSDRILLAHSPFFERCSHPAGDTKSLSSQSSTPPNSPPGGYWSHLSEIAHSMMLKSPTSSGQLDEQRKQATSNALREIVAWDPSAKLHDQRRVRRDSLIRASLDDEAISVDMLVASKLDASFKMLSDQIGQKQGREKQGPIKDTGGQQTSKAAYFPIEQEAYAERALSQYTGVLWEYYTAASKRVGVPPAAPKLEFMISAPSGSD